MLLELLQTYVWIRSFCLPALPHHGVSLSYCGSMHCYDNRNRHMTSSKTSCGSSYTGKEHGVIHIPSATASTSTSTSWATLSGGCSGCGESGVGGKCCDELCANCREFNCERLHCGNERLHSCSVCYCSSCKVRHYTCNIFVMWHVVGLGGGALSDCRIFSQLLMVLRDDDRCPFRYISFHNW